MNTTHVSFNLKDFVILKPKNSITQHMIKITWKWINIYNIIITAWRFILWKFILCWVGFCWYLTYPSLYYWYCKWFKPCFDVVCIAKYIWWDDLYFIFRENFSVFICVKNYFSMLFSHLLNFIYRRCAEKWWKNNLPDRKKNVYVVFCIFWNIKRLKFDRFSTKIVL